MLGLRHGEILMLLRTVDDVIISMSTLRRTLEKMGLHRRKNHSDPLDVAAFLIDQVESYGSLHGYKFHHLKCIQQGYVVSQTTVRHLLKFLDPSGVEQRRRRRLMRRVYLNPGPNFMWHVDSYDKLKPFGICINGAIDGFSRQMIWLHAFSTSSDPKVIAGYFIAEVERRMGTPARIRADFGTENVTMAEMQKFLRWTADPSASNCFISGSSNHNQRIESWWGFLRTHHAQFWMNRFHDLKENDYFSGDFLDKQLVLFTFLKIVEEELQMVCHLWNTHIIRHSRNTVAPSGRPVLMYTIPHLFGGQQYLVEVSQEAVDACKEECRQRGAYPCDETVFSLCCHIMSENFLLAPSTADEAIELYKFLRTYIRLHNDANMLHFM
uniref:Integrase core domain-containing protein n=1 Tax=Poecilia formosa TaxID=48698 RepID=A0A096M6N5_POEFO